LAFFTGCVAVLRDVRVLVVIVVVVIVWGAKAAVLRESRTARTIVEIQQDLDAIFMVVLYCWNDYAVVNE